jgi:hypothetical protein
MRPFTYKIFNLHLFIFLCNVKFTSPNICHNTISNKKNNKLTINIKFWPFKREMVQIIIVAYRGTL